MAGRNRIWPRAPQTDSRFVLILIVAALLLGGRAFLAEHPEHNPWAPLDLRDPRGWATGAKLADLRGDPEECRAVLERSEIAFVALDPAGEGECRREDRLRLSDAGLSPADAQITCPVAAGLVLWAQQDLQALAQETLGSQVERIEQLGTYSCRRINGADSGRWSEHATGNAIYIAGFVLADGRRIGVRGDWGGESAEGQFLQAARDAACESFGTVLSPEYNQAHADHFHFDQGRSPGFDACR